ncbi:hypothetical protein PN36_18105 [Candidatus Thiomargarita nelsonii]|uniref:Uncharacterized protein n=1 Tax=Candidatus Thiomargarita nelsonii TaxID=1003181 RepID=A0A0A6P6R6_9GAMM|nr:hypothetical protein PN36_18105 [Candidatus Thiomargarita nelsonii]
MALLLYLGFAGFIEYLAKKSNMEVPAKQRLYNWAYTSFELPVVYFPKHSNMHRLLTKMSHGYVQNWAAG